MLQDDAFCKQESWKRATKPWRIPLKTLAILSLRHSDLIQVQDLLLRCREIAWRERGNQLTSPFQTTFWRSDGRFVLATWGVTIQNPWWKDGFDKDSPVSFFPQIWRFHLEKSIPTDMKPGSSSPFWEFWSFGSSKENGWGGGGEGVIITHFFFWKIGNLVGLRHMGEFALSLLQYGAQFLSQHAGELGIDPKTSLEKPKMRKDFVKTSRKLWQAKSFGWAKRPQVISHLCN